MSDSEAPAVRVREYLIEGILLLEPLVYRDERGSFRELFRTESFEAATGIVRPWLQDSYASSTRNVLRGIHYQLDPPQGKLVSCVRGEIFDVAVDLRRLSPTFGQWVGETLSEANGRQLWIAEGFGHGYLVTGDVGDVHYKATAQYSPESYRAIAWNDPDIGIDWPIEYAPMLSETDKTASSLRGADVFS